MWESVCLLGGNEGNPLSLISTSSGMQMYGSRASRETPICGDASLAAGVKLLPYCISSALAIIPWSILFCYFGSLARNITEILEGKAGPSGKQSMLLLAVSGVVLVFVVVYSTIIARCAQHAALLRSP